MVDRKINLVQMVIQKAEAILHKICKRQTAIVGKTNYSIENVDLRKYVGK